MNQFTIKYYLIIITGTTYNKGYNYSSFFLAFQDNETIVATD